MGLAPAGERYGMAQQERADALRASNELERRTTQKNKDTGQKLAADPVHRRRRTIKRCWASEFCILPQTLGEPKRFGACAARTPRAQNGHLGCGASPGPYLRTCFMVGQTPRTRRKSPLQHAASAATAPVSRPSETSKVAAQAVDSFEVCAGTCAGASTCARRARMLATRDAHLAVSAAPGTQAHKHVAIGYEGQVPKAAPGVAARPRIPLHLDF